MKHVGLNVAADPFLNSALTQIVGGFVVVVADDPGMHSSQNEQDSRYYADFARIVCYEPADHQEAYDMTRLAFEVSETWNIPVMIRLVTRLSHSRSSVKTRMPRPQNTPKKGTASEWTLLPSHSRRRYRLLVEKQAALINESNHSDFNVLTLNPKNTSQGIIASGIAFNYVMENFADAFEVPSLLKISTYPLPEDLISKLAAHVETILVVEDGYPLIESRLKGLLGLSGKNIIGKLSGHLPATGELQPHLVREAMNLDSLIQDFPEEFTPAARPPQLCKGCPHADTLLALKEVMNEYPGASTFSDIGCFTLGALPPYNAVDTCVCMGASISMAKGASDVGLFPSVGVIGDHSFAQKP
jgi:indolepyruvate ferredoxin oxidoreductase alpha subunit